MIRVVLPGLVRRPASEKRLVVIPDEAAFGGRDPVSRYVFLFLDSGQSLCDFRNDGLRGHTPYIFFRKPFFITLSFLKILAIADSKEAAVGAKSFSLSKLGTRDRFSMEVPLL